MGCRHTFIALQGLLYSVMLSASTQALTFTTLDYPGASLTNLNGVTLYSSSSNGLKFVGTWGDSSRNIHGFVTDGTYFQSIDYRSSGYDTQATGISGDTIVGTYFRSGWLGGANGFTSNLYSINNFDNPAGYSTWANGISGNNIVGTSDYDSPGAWGYFYNGTTFKTIMYPSAWRTEALGVWNDKVVGTYNNSHSYLYDGTNYTPIDFPSAPYTYANGIAESWIVGEYLDSSHKSHGFIYDGSNYYTVDNPLGTQGTTLTGIDGFTEGNYHWFCVTGTYTDSAGVSHGFYTEMEGVPEPASIGLLALGSLALLRRRRSSF